MERPASALSQEPDSDNDYTLRQNPPGCWITVDTITVRISRCFEGVKVFGHDRNNSIKDSTVEQLSRRSTR